MTNRLVLKIGGSSLKNDKDYTHIAKKIAEQVRIAEKPIVVVISAKEGETNRLWEEAGEIYSSKWWQLEYVALSGEFHSAHTMQEELLSMGLKAKFVSPWDIDLRVTGKDPENCTLIGANEELFKHEVTESSVDVVIIPGYVGIHTTAGAGKSTPALAALGRNSTDLIAVEIARCYNAPLYFVKSAPTIYAVSPKLVGSPKKIPHMTYEQALRFLEYLPQNDQFIMRKAVELAWKNKVELTFGSLKGLDETKISASLHEKSGSGFRAMPVKESVSMVSFEMPADNKTRANLFREFHSRGIRFNDKIEVRSGGRQHFTLFVDESMEKSVISIAEHFSVNSEGVEAHAVALITLLDTMLDPESHHSSIESEALEKEDVEIYGTVTSGIIMHIYVARKDVRKAVKILANKFVLCK
ncbi:MAG: hypothetical protein WDZ40_01670 [Candidatus Spechtbacterales bacterium]